MNADLQGNINLQDPEAGKPPVFAAPPVLPQMPPQPSGKARLPTEWRNLNTLDEPVCETIVRQLINRSAIEERSGEDLAQAFDRHQPLDSYFQ